jgi:SNF2 family DNA or RNA helicase
MNIWQTRINSNLGPISNASVKLITYINGYLYLSIDSKNIQKYIVDRQFEKYVFFEIINNSPLWSTQISTQSAIIVIDIYFDTSLIDDYINKSLALSLLISAEFDNLPRYTKFNSDKSFFPNNEPYEPLNLNIKLYDYQKKSLGKMIEMEHNLINFEFEYTKQINFKNLININYDPIKNIISDKKRIFKIVANGGILADEMGLGKTITTVALISCNPSTENIKIKYSVSDEYNKIYTKATLIVCPSHISKQWETEAKKTNSKLKILTILTKKDHDKIYYSDIIEADIIITTHQFLMNFKYYPALNYITIRPSLYNPKDRSLKLRNYFCNNMLKDATTAETDKKVGSFQNPEINSYINDATYEKIKNMNCPLFEYFYFHRLVLDEGHEIFGENLGNISQSRYMSDWLSSINANNYWYVSGSPFTNYRGILNSIKYLNLTLHDTDFNFKIDSKTFENFEIFNNVLNKEYLWNSILEKICIRHRKCDVSDEIKIFGYNENIEWINFTDLESKLYERQKEKLSNEALQQLCCHLLVLDSYKRQLGTNIETDLSVMQTKLIAFHTKSIKEYTIKLSKLDSSKPEYNMLKKSYTNIMTESNYMLKILDKLKDNDLDTNDDENCPICLDKVLVGSLTKCGHIFCKECIETCLKFKSLCPSCKQPINANEIFIINNKSKPKKEITVNPLIDKYGSKLGKIIIMIKNIVTKPEARIIIFSQWDTMLTLIGSTLSENGIANCFVKGNVWSRNSAINRFKNGKTISGEDNKIIILSLKNAASGTNLTEATHIFFVEPINGTKEEIKAIEGQAIGRVCRLGQKQKVEVFRILVKNTIEEEIYKRNNNITTDNSIEI